MEAVATKMVGCPGPTQNNIDRHGYVIAKMQQLQPKFYKCYVIKHGFMYIYPV